MPTAPADDRDEFDFPVHRPGRQGDDSVWPGQRGGKLREHRQILGHGQGRFGSMIGVVEADRKDLPRLWYWIAEFTWLHLREGFACCAVECGSDLQQFVPTFIAFLNPGTETPAGFL